MPIAAAIGAASRVTTTISAETSASIRSVVGPVSRHNGEMGHRAAPVKMSSRLPPPASGRSRVDRGGPLGVLIDIPSR